MGISNEELAAMKHRPSPTWQEKFIANLDKAIGFHRSNQNDPHNIGNAAILCLTETRNAFAKAHRLPLS